MATQPTAPPDPDTWKLTLYIAGLTERSTQTLANLRQVCEERLEGRYDIEVIDLLKRPELAAAHQIVAVPTVVRRFPAPERKIIGDLSKKERVLVGLGIQPQEAA